MQMRRVPSSGWRGYTTLVLSADGGADRVPEYGCNKTVEEEEDEVKVTSLKQGFFFLKKKEEKRRRSTAVLETWWVWRGKCRRIQLW